MMVHVEEESDVLCGMRTNQRRHKANEDDMTYTVDIGGACVKRGHIVKQFVRKSYLLCQITAALYSALRYF